MSLNTAESIKDYLGQQKLVVALWWFIENRPEDPAICNEVFFYLRERMRHEC